MSGLLNNRYRILQTLGSGGFGETFLAEDTNSPSKRRCVIKKLKPKTDNADTWELIKDRFEREAAILEKLGDESAQIPSLKAYFDENQEFYLVQDWIEGENLCEIVKANGRFDESAVREFLLEILPVLDFVHSQGIIHRDIKPENIMRRAKDGKYLLIDFGAVKEVATTIMDSGGTPTSSIIIGSEGFMPLEQAAGKPVFASDLYALAMTAIYLLTAKRPKAMSDLTTGDIAWQKFALPVAADLAAVLDKAIEERARDRFPTASEMLAALQPESVKLLTPAPLPSNRQIENLSELDTIAGGNTGGKNSVNFAASKTVENESSLPFVPNPPAPAKMPQAWLIVSGLLILVFVLVGGFTVLRSIFPLQPADATATNSNRANANVANLSNSKPSNANTAAANSSNSNTVKNSIGMEFVKIPVGIFYMGSPKSEAGSKDGETPQHLVTISRSFYMGKTEVTQEQWQAVMGDNPSSFKNCLKCPVENVSWDDAQEFIKKLNAKNEGAYRLPTEAEWEYAARAKTTGAYPGNLDSMAWYDKNSGGKTHEVGMKVQNDFGLYDMHGNVWEWCSDWYGDYSSGAVTDPTGAASGSYRVFRGGSWGSGAANLRSAFRGNNLPSDRRAYVGFRVVRMAL